MATFIPDPDGLNDQRAEWVEGSLNWFGSYPGQDPHAPDDELVSDFLADLGHYCDAKGLDLPTLLMRAQMNYDAETDNEGTQFSGK